MVMPVVDSYPEYGMTNYKLCLVAKHYNLVVLPPTEGSLAAIGVPSVQTDAGRLPRRECCRRT